LFTVRPTGTFDVVALDPRRRVRGCLRLALGVRQTLGGDLRVGVPLGVVARTSGPAGSCSASARAYSKSPVGILGSYAGGQIVVGRTKGKEVSMGFRRRTRRRALFVGGMAGAGVAYLARLHTSGAPTDEEFFDDMSLIEQIVGV
jgi:hypothetical protein